MPPLPTNLESKLREMCEQYDAINAQLVDPAVTANHRQVTALSVRRKAMEPIVDAYRAREAIHKQMDELQIMTAGGESDKQLLEMAKEELASLEVQSDELVERIQRSLVHADDDTVASVIVEIRGGVGGAEAAIWAGDLAQMYQGFSTERKWSFELMDQSVGDMGGYKWVIVRITGDGVWTALGHEGGTHQVKRVPATEAQGRVHTSTATVAVLPEPEEVELKLDKADVKEMITTAQGPGGQNVNKVATAVHLIHVPTGIEVRMQDTKSQTQNREKAWALLRARLYERQLAEANAERAQARSEMIGTARRAEKIRTYRYKENIVVDHRAGESFHLGEVMAGRMQLLVDALVEHETAKRLAAL